MNNQELNSVNMSVKDFQIIKNANLTFLPGLNCLIGQSNNGKSALMRAAKTCLYNEPGTSSVRLGCSNFAIGMQMNGHTIILQKGNNSIYKIDGEVFGKIGRTQLEEVAKATGIKQLNINGVNETINFWDQMEKPFLLDRSETDLFRFIVDSGKDNNVTTALKTLTQDRQQLTKDITITEGKLAQLDESIKRQEEELKDADLKINTYNRVIELGPKIKRLDTITNLKNKSLLDGKELSTVIMENSKYNSILTKVETSLNKINTNSKTVEILSKLISSISNINYNLDIEEHKLSTFTNIRIPDFDLLKRKYNLVSDLITKVKDKQVKLNEYESLVSSISHLNVPNLNKRLEEYKLLSNLVMKSTGTLNEIKRLNNTIVPTLDININDKVKKYTDLSNLINNILSNQDQISTLNDKVSNIEKELDLINNEIKEIGICPTCGQPIHNN